MSNNNQSHETTAIPYPTGYTIVEHCPNGNDHAHSLEDPYVQYDEESGTYICPLDDSDGEEIHVTIKGG